ncbi:Rv3235 family protein [Nocardioides sp.]|uniref:Rv3235 family protein n=1 Tax=Nocardioides sp. TaxID=35761 RepID=UPI003D0BE8DF
MSTSQPDVTHLRRPVPLQPTQGTLALDLAGHLDPPAPTEETSAVQGDVVPIDVLAKRQLESWARRYAQAAVEIVNGDRPASQLVRWTSPRVHEELTRRAQIVARAGVHQAGLGRGRRPVVRPAVQSLRSCFISPVIAEVSIHVRHGQRSRALAARFEHRNQKWICTALEFA